MEKEKHDIKTIFSITDGFEDVKPLDPTDKSVVGQIGTKIGFEKREKPVASEGVYVYLTYEVGQPVSGTERKFKQLIADKIVEVLRGLRYGEFEIKTVNVNIPDVPEE